MIYKITLDNGLQIVADQDLNSKTCTIQYVVAAGSLDEEGLYTGENNFGAAHFIEHMLFKGTEKRDVNAINEDIASIGGTVNAYTSFDHTCFYISSPADVWSQNLEILNDIFWNSILDEKEFNNEKLVILEELKMYEDQPRSKCLEQLDITCNSRYDNRQRIAGTINSVKNLTVNDLKRLMKKFYQPNNIMLIASGNVPIDKFVAEAEYYTKNKQKEIILDRNTVFNDDTLNGRIAKIQRNDLAQASFAFMVKGVPPYEEEYFTQEIIADILGHGFTSRLYRIIREEKGLAYTVSASLHTLRDSSYIMGYCGLDPNNIEEVYHIIATELNKLKYEYVDFRELDIMKNVYKGQTLLALEPTSAKISIHEDNFIYGTNYTIDDIIENIEKVTSEKIMDFAKKYINVNNICWSIVEPK